MTEEHADASWREVVERLNGVGLTRKSRASLDTVQMLSGNVNTTTAINSGLNLSASVMERVHQGDVLCFKQARWRLRFLGLRLTIYKHVPCQIRFPDGSVIMAEDLS